MVRLIWPCCCCCYDLRRVIGWTLKCGPDDGTKFENLPRFRLHDRNGKLSGRTCDSLLVDTGRYGSLNTVFFFLKIISFPPSSFPAEGLGKQNKKKNGITGAPVACCSSLSVLGFIFNSCPWASFLLLLNEKRKRFSSSIRNHSRRFHPIVVRDYLNKKTWARNCVRTFICFCFLFALQREIIVGGNMRFGSRT